MNCRCELCGSNKTIWIQVNDCLWALNHGGVLKYGVPQIAEDLNACIDCGHVWSKSFKRN